MPYPVSVEMLQEKHESLVRAREDLRRRYVDSPEKEEEFNKDIARVDALIEGTRVHMEFLALVLAN